jgi:hypothetical protein
MANESDPIVILSYARTPMGSFQGALSPLSATEREKYAELTAKVKGQLQNLAGAAP